MRLAKRLLRSICHDIWDFRGRYSAASVRRYPFEALNLTNLHRLNHDDVASVESVLMIGL